MDIEKHKTLITQLIKGYQLGSSHWVTITHINDPLSFYIRGTQYDLLLEAIEAQVPNCKDIQDRIVCLSNPTASKTSYIRGLILSTYEIDGERVCDLQTIDYGYLKKAIPLQHIWICNDNIRHIPPLAVHCQLSNCAPVGNKEWSKEAIEAMIYYCGNERLKMIINGKTPNKLNVTLINSCPDDIGTLLALTGFSTLGYSHNEVSRIPAVQTKKMLFKFNDIIPNKILHVRMQYALSLNEFYVIEVGDYKNLMQNKDFMSNLAKQQKGLTDEELFKNMPICVLDDLRNCNRAIVRSYESKSKVSVQLVDTGKKLITNILDIKQIPDLWLAEPVTTIYCRAEESQLQDFRLHRIFQPGFEFLITIKQLGLQFDSPNIVKISMIEKNSKLNY